MVVVQKSGKKIKNPFKGRKNKNFWSNRLILIRNHVRNKKKMVPLIEKIPFLRKTDISDDNVKMRICHKTGKLKIVIKWHYKVLGLETLCSLGFKI